MILSDKTIEKLLAEGSLAIEPLEPEQIQPASVDIRLGDTFGIVEDTPSGIVGWRTRSLQDDPHRPLHPAAGPVRAGNHHGVRAPGRRPHRLRGRAQLAGAHGAVRAERRLGGSGLRRRDHAGAVQREPLRAGAALGQARGAAGVAQLDEAAKNPYAGKYQGQRGATARACTSIRRQRASTGAPCRSPRRIGGCRADPPPFPQRFCSPWMFYDFSGLADLTC